MKPELEHVAGHLAGLKVVEMLNSEAADPSVVAVAFAGMVAAGFGGSVVTVGSAPDFEPAQSRFLGRGKRAARDSDDLSDHILLTNDPNQAALWTGPSSVLVRAARGRRDKHSELTLQAESGLLDVVGVPGQAPLPLPGHQIAYAGGMAAFSALAAGWHAHLAGKKPEAAEVSLLDVALWLNWKHYLAASLGQANPGIGRVEEWTTVRCADGYIALVFQDKDMPALAELTGNDFFDRPELRNRATRKPFAPQLRGIVEAWAASRTRAEISARAQAIRLPIGPVLDLGELADDRQLRERLAFTESGFPRLPLLSAAAVPTSAQLGATETPDVAQ